MTGNLCGALSQQPLSQSGTEGSNPVRSSGKIPPFQGKTRRAFNGFVGGFSGLGQSISNKLYFDVTTITESTMSRQKNLLREIAAAMSRAAQRAAGEPSRS
jgi:hypothetical protein